jgi:hypothetical protein
MGEVLQMKDYRRLRRAATTEPQMIIHPLPLAIWVMLAPWTFFWPADWGDSK